MHTMLSLRACLLLVALPLTLGTQYAIACDLTVQCESCPAKNELFFNTTLPVCGGVPEAQVLASFPATVLAGSETLIELDSDFFVAGFVHATAGELLVDSGFEGQQGPNGTVCEAGESMKWGARGTISFKAPATAGTIILLSFGTIPLKIALYSSTKPTHLPTISA
jgi:hypothetical protein